MATVITEECINCGACEPECPNTAIYQGGVEYEWQGASHAALSNDFFYIVPEKCTECVGFFDHEACAAVCPVDCCVPDPQRPETEDVLIARAKQIHPDTDFGSDFPSRFKKAGEAAAAAPSPSAEAEGKPAPAAKPSPAPAAKPSPAPAAKPSPTPAAKPSPTPAAKPSSAPAAEPAASLHDFDVPLECRSCGCRYAVAYRFLTPGTVLRCPVCDVMSSPSQRMYVAVGKRLERFADELNAEIDRHEDLVQTEDKRFAANTARIRQSVADDVARIVDELTEPPKKSMFG